MRAAASSPAWSGTGCEASTTSIRLQAAPWPYRVTTRPSTGWFWSSGHAHSSGPGHHCRGLARANHDGAPVWPRWQMWGDATHRVGCGDCAIEQASQKVRWVPHDQRKGCAQASPGRGIRCWAIFAANPARVTQLVDLRQQIAKVDFTGARFVPPRRVGQLHMTDDWQDALDCWREIAFHDLHVVNIVLHQCVSFADLSQDIDCLLGGVQKKTPACRDH